MRTYSTHVREKQGKKGVLLRTIYILILFLIFMSAACAQEADKPARENVPPLTEEMVNRIASEPVSSAKLGQLENGTRQMLVNGRRMPFIFGCMPMFEPMEDWHVQVWKDAGIKLVHIFGNIAFYDPRRGYGEHHRPFWTGKDTYDRGMVDEVLWRVLRVHPDAKILLTLSIDAYPGWYKDHPDELMRNEAGDAFVVGHHFRRIGGEKDIERSDEVLAWSFFSEQYYAEAAEAVKEFIRTVDSSVPGKRVIGYVVGGGQDLQNYMWHPPNAVRQDDPMSWGDYSKPAIRAWHQWLRAKYGSASALSRAWNQMIQDFETAGPPPAASLIGKEVFHDPRTEQQAVDWKRFLAEGRSRYLLRLAEVVKTVSAKDVIVGTYSGESGCRMDVTDNAALLASPWMDFLFHQPMYGRRRPPNASGFNAVLDSHQTNGKLFMADMDFKSWLSADQTVVGGKGVSQSSITVGRASNMEQLRSMWRRELGRLWASGTGCHFHPLHCAYMFKDPAIVEELSHVWSMAEEFGAPDLREPIAETVVIFDETAIAYLKGGLARLHWTWWSAQIKELNASGVPLRKYYASDLRAGRVPTGKLYLFLNLINIDPGLARAIEELKAAGRTLVFLQHTGYVQRIQDQGEDISRVMGIKVDTNAASGDEAVKGHALMRAFGEGFSAEAEGIKYSDLALCVTDPEAAVLAEYAGGEGKAGFAVREHTGYKSVFVGTEMLTPKMTHALAAYSGARRVAPVGNSVAVTDEFLMIHPLETGAVKINLPEPAAMQAYPPETIRTPKARTQDVELEEGNTVIFNLKTN